MGFTQWRPIHDERQRLLNNFGTRCPLERDKGYGAGNLRRDGSASFGDSKQRRGILLTFCCSCSQDQPNHRVAKHNRGLQLQASCFLNALCLHPMFTAPIYVMYQDYNTMRSASRVIEVELAISGRLREVVENSYRPRRICIQTRQPFYRRGQVDFGKSDLDLHEALQKVQQLQPGWGCRDCACQRTQLRARTTTPVL